MFFIKIYIKESYINYYDTSIQMCGQYCILAPIYGGAFPIALSVCNLCHPKENKYRCGCNQNCKWRCITEEPDLVLLHYRVERVPCSGEPTHLNK